MQDGRRLGKKKELGKDGLDATDFCPYQVAKWVKDHKMVLFDETACDNMHPLYNDMKKCTKSCWDSMKTKLNGDVPLLDAVLPAVHVRSIIEDKMR